MRKFFKLLSANSAGVLINILAQLFSIPLFLHNWNKELYGEWLVLTAVPSLLWSLEGGLGVLATTRMMLAAAVSDWKAVNEIYQTTITGQIIITLFLFAGSVVFVFCTNVSSILNLHTIPNSDAAFILMVMISYMLIGMIMSVYRAAYRASEKEVRAALLVNFWRATDLLIVICVLLLHGTPTRMAECMFVGVFVWVTLGFLDVQRQCPKVHFGLGAASGPRFKEMIVHGVPMLAGQLTTALYMQGFPIVVNSTLGSASVVTLTTLRTICRLGLMPVQNVAYATSPQLSRSYGARDMALFHRMLKIMAVAAFWSGIALVMGLVTVGPWLLSQWTGGRVSVSHLTIGLFALSIAFQGLWVCFQNVLGCCNKHHFFNYFYCGSVILSLGVTLLLARSLGFTVVPAIMATSDLMVASLGFYLCIKKLDGFNPGALLCVFQADFYRGLIAKMVSYRRPAATP